MSEKSNKPYMKWIWISVSLVLVIVIVQVVSFMHAMQVAQDKLGDYIDDGAKLIFPFYDNQ